MQRCRPPSGAGSGQNGRSASAPRSRRRRARRDQPPENSPSGISPHADARAAAGRRADRVLAALLDAVDASGAASATDRRRSRTRRRRSSGTSKVDRDRVVGELARRRHLQRVEAGAGRATRRPPSDLLHVLERLEAVRAAVERLAGGRAVLRGQLGSRRAAPRAGHRPGRRHQGQRDRAAGPRRRSGRGQPVLTQCLPAALGDPVARPGRAERDLARGRRSRHR